MANVYVDSNAAGAGTGADWANAYTTLGAAAAAKAAGDSFWVAHNHAETAAAVKTITFPGTAANPNFVYCVTSAGSVPPVSADLRTTGTVSNTGNNAMTINGSLYCTGLSLSCGSGAASPTFTLLNSASGRQFYKNSSFTVGGTNGGALEFGTLAGGRSCEVVFDNTTVTVNSTTSFINPCTTRFFWRNTASALGGATFPTTLIKNTDLTLAYLATLEGVDLSALGSGKTIIGNTDAPSLVILKDCKLGASVTVQSTPAAPGATEVLVIRSDSSGTNYRHEKYQYTGTQTVETTIVRTGGASDGTTPIAWKLVTTANSKWVLPFEALPIAIWNDSTASVTVTVYGIWGGGAVPNNDEIWMDVEYLGASGNPLGSFATSTKADNLATGSALTTDTSTWGGSTTKFKMTATFTPAQKGAIYIYVKAAKTSSTFYIDPKPVLS